MLSPRRYPGYGMSAEGQGLFKFKEGTNIPALTFVDDTLVFMSCGTESVKLNAKYRTSLRQNDWSWVMINAFKCMLVPR